MQDFRPCFNSPLLCALLLAVTGFWILFHKCNLKKFKGTWKFLAGIFCHLAKGKPPSVLRDPPPFNLWVKWDLYCFPICHLSSQRKLKQSIIPYHIRKIENRIKITFFSHSIDSYAIILKDHPHNLNKTELTRSHLGGTTH